MRCIAIGDRVTAESRSRRWQDGGGQPAATQFGLRFSRNAVMPSRPSLLARTRVTGASLPQLEAMGALLQVDLRGLELPRRGLRRLRANRPLLEVLAEY